MGDVGCVSPLHAVAFRGVDGTGGTVGGGIDGGGVGGDVDAWNGAALYASIYNGNVDATKTLLHNLNATTRYFGVGQKSFCISLMVVEVLAFVMFVGLVGIWVYGVVQAMGSGGGGIGDVGEGGEKISGGDGTMMAVAQLAGLAVPLMVALGVLYRLVPLHGVVQGYRIVCFEQSRRSRVLSSGEDV